MTKRSHSFIGCNIYLSVFPFDGGKLETRELFICISTCLLSSLCNESEILKGYDLAVIELGKGSLEELNQQFCVVHQLKALGIGGKLKGSLILQRFTLHCNVIAQAYLKCLIPNIGLHRNNVPFISFYW